MSKSDVGIACCQISVTHVQRTFNGHTNDTTGAHHDEMVDKLVAEAGLWTAIMMTTPDVRTKI